MDIAVFDALQAARRAKQPVALVTDLASGGQCLLGDDGQVIGVSAGAPNLTAADIAETKRAEQLEIEEFCKLARLIYDQNRQEPAH